MPRIEWFIQLNVAPARTERSPYVVDQKVVKRKPTPRVKQAILHGDYSLPFELGGDDRLSKSLLALSLNPLRLGPRNDLIYLLSL